MLVKSFTDDLAWKVQRQLTPILKIQVQSDCTHIRKNIKAVHPKCT